MIRIKKLSKEDINQVTRIHKEELPGFLSELGEGFLKKFYRQSLYIPELFTFVVKENEQILGFVTGITATKGLYKKIILRDSLGFGVIFLRYLITHLDKIFKIFQTITYPGFSHDTPELLTIAVIKKQQRRGLGRKLFGKAVDEFRKRGIKNLKISAYARLPANGFYKKMGCKRQSSFMFLGERMNYYRYNI